MLQKPVKPEDLLNDKVLAELGPWSMYGLAEEALKHYFPEEYEIDEMDDDGNVLVMGACKGGVRREADLVQKMGFTYWTDVVKKYQQEVGYNAIDGFHEGAVNEF